MLGNATLLRAIIMEFRHAIPAWLMGARAIGIFTAAAFLHLTIRSYCAYRPIGVHWNTANRPFHRFAEGFDKGASPKLAEWWTCWLSRVFARCFEYSHSWFVIASHRKTTHWDLM